MDKQRVTNTIFLKAIYEGKYVIIALVFMSVIGTAIFGYLTVTTHEVSALVKPGYYIGDAGNVGLVASPEAIEQVVAQGSFNATIEKSLPFRLNRPLEIKAILPKGSNIVKVSYETKNVKEGEAVIGALLALLKDYYGKEKTEKYDPAAKKYLQTLKTQLPVLELRLIKSENAKAHLKHETGKLLMNHKQVMKDKEGIEGRMRSLKTSKDADDLFKFKTELTNKQIELIEEDLAIRDKQAALTGEENESAKLGREIGNIKKQIETVETVLKDGKGIEIVQSPLAAATGFKERMAKWIFTASVISLVAGILLSFVMYDIKYGKTMNS